MIVTLLVVTYCDCIENGSRVYNKSRNLKIDPWIHTAAGMGWLIEEYTYTVGLAIQGESWNLMSKFAILFGFGQGKHEAID